MQVLLNEFMGGRGGGGAEEMVHLKNLTLRSETGRNRGIPQVKMTKRYS